MLAAILPVFSTGQSASNQADSARLAAVLKKAGEYCQRLERAALDFVCLEEVTELSVRFTPVSSVHLYDYQFIRKNQETKEKRDLVAVDGKKVNVRDSALQTVMFSYENVLFGPVGLLSPFWQAHHDYRIVGEEGTGQGRAVIIEAKPGADPRERHPYGRLWVREDDGGVLKIVWDQESLGNFRYVEEWAKSHDVEPRVTAFCEYGVEKNGLRFPSRNYSEQAYVDKDGRKIVGAMITVSYKKYKFFTVETEVKY